MHRIHQKHVARLVCAACAEAGGCWFDSWSGAFFCVRARIGGALLFCSFPCGDRSDDINAHGSRAEPWRGILDQNDQSGAKRTSKSDTEGVCSFDPFINPCMMSCHLMV